MGAGSSKRVHPEAAFHAADADKDGRLTLQELGAMLQAQGIAWSPKRIKGLLCAFDENDDGGDFSKPFKLVAGMLQKWFFTRSVRYQHSATFLPVPRARCCNLRFTTAQWLHALFAGI